MVFLAPLAAPPTFALIPYREVDPRARRVRLGPARSTGNTGTACQVFVDGRVVGETPDRSTVSLAPCGVPGGIAGTVEGSVDGAYLASTSLGFAAWPGHRQAFNGERVEGVSRDGSALVVRQDDFMSEGHTDPGEAAIVKKGHRMTIGAAERAWIAPGGTVVGFAFAKKDGGYVGDHSESERYRATPEAFVWKVGRRRVLGDWIAMDVNHRGTILGGRSPGAPSNFSGPSDSSRLFLYRNGRETPLNRHDLPFRGRAFLRDDDSVVALFHGVPREEYGTTSLAILRGDRVERIPETIGGRRPDWYAFSVDAKGRIFVPEGRTMLWQVVRSHG